MGRAKIACDFILRFPLDFYGQAPILQFLAGGLGGLSSGLSLGLSIFSVDDRGISLDLGLSRLI